MISKRIAYLSVFILCLAGCFKIAVSPSKAKNNDKASYDNEQADAKNELSYLNAIRADPDSYSKIFGVDLGNIKANKALVWNDTLAVVAQDKALDMAKRNYFAHIDPDGNGINIKIVQAGYYLLPDWYSDRSQNNFESLEAGSSSAKEAIKDLIIDKGTPSLGHRLHLLGQGDFWGNCYDIGIGEIQVKGPSSDNYTSYFSFVIAKHKF